ncbi:MAG: hypothetical protein DWQ10_18475 [Calditrichaeota bacterium]|nr:MAG: hypothetical protein DWQ10_18475 [Calditrichota bacterium]
MNISNVQSSSYFQAINQNESLQASKEQQMASQAQKSMESPGSEPAKDQNAIRTQEEGKGLQIDIAA